MDIQSILNGTAKFCRHCDVVILGSMITKKASVFGLVGGSVDDQSEDDDDIHFCSSACFVQFAVTHRVGGVGKTFLANLSFLSCSMRDQSSVGSTLVIQLIHELINALQPEWYPVRMGRRRPRWWTTSAARHRLRPMR